MDITPVAQAPNPGAQDAKLLKAAQKLEASFLAEMLKAAGYGEARDSFGGGAGEAHFSSFLVDAQAEKMVESGGIGLAEHVFSSLKDRENDR
ncbi:MAG: rod-binding protein [Pseudomonadota bacterium]